MIPIAFRALSTVLTVVVAILVSYRWDDTNTGKLVAAVIIAFVIAVMEWFLRWSPKHFALARRLLDPRSVWTGMWLQVVTLVNGKGSATERSNEFALFSAEYDGGYFIDGVAYNAQGSEHARWQSKNDPMFTRNGRGMSYVFTGTITDRAVKLAERERIGLVTMRLAGAATDAGSGWVEHVAVNAKIEFDLYRVSKRWLAQHDLGRFDPADLTDSDTRKEFAVAFARIRTKQGARALNS